MAVIQKPNTEYWALKERVDNCNYGFMFFLSMMLLPVLSFGGAFIGGRLFHPNGGALGFLIGGVSTQMILLSHLKRKLGFIISSKESCQSCDLPLAEWRGIKYRAFEICPNCGNDNRIDLHDP